MLILSHRGYHLRAPENTLDAFEQAMALGVDGIETDIRLSADGVLILFHDHLAPDCREVALLTHAELGAATGYPVPTLEAALELPLQAKPDFLWNLEMKSPAALDKAISVVSRFLSSRRMLITSFAHPLIAEVSRRVDVDCGLIVAHRPLDFRSRPKWIPENPRVNAIVWYCENADAALLEQSAACGLRNFVYGAVTAAEHHRLKEWNLDGVITDRPEWLLAGSVGT